MFQKILKHLGSGPKSSSNNQKSAAISLQRSYHRLKIWSDENGVAPGDLESILTASTPLQRETLKLILSIAEILTESMYSLPSTLARS